ncbi:MAG: hypothetical protein LBN33_10720, partial [Desulfovibrio sp.]|nr:hypothetical protein [Desulfovibrio sp.]
MANEKPSNKTSAASLPLGLLFGLPALLGVTLTIAMYCILSWSAKNEFRDTARAESLRSLAAVKANFAHLYSRLSQYSNLIAQNLNNREDRLYAILEQSKTLWPEINFSFYDRSSEPYPIALQALSGDALPLPRTTRYMLHNALLGNTATDITLTRGFLSLSTITPAPPGKIRAAMATLPLDPNTLGNIKKNAQADLAILPLDDNGERLVTGNASTTFLKSWDSSLDRWGEILKILPDIKNEIQTRNIGSQTIQASFEPLKDSFGTIVGVLVVAPLTAPAVFSESTRMLCACLTGLGVAILALLALYLYGDRLISSIAADINFIASENAVEARLTTYKGRWPVILETALRKTALT